MIRFFSLAVLILSHLPELIAQSSNQAESDSILKIHYNLFDSISANCLFNSEDYVRGKFHHPKGTKDNHPFFPDFNWRPGNLEADGIQYTAPLLKYDIENDALIILKVINNQGFPIELERSVIRKFRIDDHNFVYLSDVPACGYYEELFDGKVSVWAKRTIWKKIDAQTDLKVHRYMTNFYFVIRKDQTHYEIKNLRGFYRVFNDQKQRIRKYKKDNRLSFNNDPSYTVKKLTEYYHMLTTP